MSVSTQTPRTRALTIAHVTDLRQHEHSAFEHAVALAWKSESKLISIHANDDDASLARMPKAIDVLSRWRALPERAQAGDEKRLGMEHVRLLDNCCDDPADTLLRAVRNADAQLLVAAATPREGLARTALGNLAETLALNLSIPTLLFPLGCTPFVSPQGELSLGRVLVAAGDATVAKLGATYAAWFADLISARDLDVELLHVRGDGPAPMLSLPERANTHFRMQSLGGAVEDTLVQRSRDFPAQLMVMATRGHDSIRDFILGSRAERVLRRAPCPLLIVPVR